MAIIPNPIKTGKRSKQTYVVELTNTDIMNCLLFMILAIILLMSVFVSCFKVYDLRKQVHELSMQVTHLSDKNISTKKTMGQQITTLEQEVNGLHVEVDDLYNTINHYQSNISSNRLESEVTVEPEPELNIDDGGLTEQINILVADITDVTKVSNATAEELNQAIQSTCKWMYEYNPNMGQVYLEKEKEYGINAYFALSVSFSEVGVNKMSNLARNDNNIYGLLNGKEYDSIEDCIDYFFRLIKNHYVGEGKQSVEAISQKYCLGDPVWIKNVSTFMRKLPERSRL